MSKVEKNTTKAAGFKVTGVVPGPVVYKGRTIDLRELSPEEGAQLAADANFRYVVPISDK